jgi:hypothetical protein
VTARSVILTGLIAAALFVLTPGLIWGEMLAAAIAPGVGQVTGDIRTVSPPSSVVLGATESNSDILLFLEKPFFELPADLDVDIAGPSGSAGVIPQGTLVHSYFLHVDSIGSTWINLAGNIFTDLPILGVITSSSRLDGTDTLLGAPSTAYPTGQSGQSRELEYPDDLALAADRQQLSVKLQTISGIDHARVLLAAVPEPSSFCLLGTAALAGSLFWFMRRAASR